MSSINALCVLQYNILLYLMRRDSGASGQSFTREISASEGIPLDVASGLLKDLYSRGYIDICNKIDTVKSAGQSAGYAITDRGRRYVDSISQHSPVVCQTRSKRMMFLASILKRVYK